MTAITNKKAKLSLIHIAKKESGIADDACRIILAGAAGIESAADLKYEYQFKAIMKAFENLGFKSTRRRGFQGTRPNWTDEWGCSTEQLAKIEVMWKTCARNKSDKALYAFIKRITHVDSPRFLRVPLAQNVILALSDMMKKAGFDPETGERILQ